MRQAIAVIIGAVVFLAAHFGIGLPFALSAGTAVLGYIAILLIVKRRRDGPRKQTPAATVDESSLTRLLEEADAKIGSIADFTRKIENLESRGRLERICKCAGGIIADIRKDPRDAPRARRFLNYYLDAVTRIMGHYSELTQRGIRSQEARAALEKVDNLFETIETAFEKQRAALARDDVLDLDAEIDLLKKTLSMEGMDHEK